MNGKINVKAMSLYVLMLAILKIHSAVLAMDCRRPIIIGDGKDIKRVIYKDNTFNCSMGKIKALDKRAERRDKGIRRRKQGEAQQEVQYNNSGAFVFMPGGYNICSFNGNFFITSGGQNIPQVPQYALINNGQVPVNIGAFNNMNTGTEGYLPQQNISPLVPFGAQNSSTPLNNQFMVSQHMQQYQINMFPTVPPNIFVPTNFSNH